MLTLDQMLDGLTVEVQPFAICEARGTSCIDLGSLPHATLHYVLAGAGTFTLAGLPSVPSSSGMIMIAPARVPHSVQADPSAECQALTCSALDADWHLYKSGDGANGVVLACGEIAIGYRGVEGLLDCLQVPLICNLDDNDAVKVSFEQILRELAEPKAGGRSLVRALMQQCLIQILRQTSVTAPAEIHWLTAAHDQRLWRVVTAIFDHPEAPHTLDTLAEIARMSRSAFADHFKRAFGRGPIDLVKQARLQLAARLLLTSQRSIKAITRDIGYTSRSYFSRAFHEHFGISPIDYRASHHRPVP